MPAALESIAPETLAGIDWLLFDIDDTVTLDGILPTEAAAALHKAKAAGLVCVAVTGRSMAWGEMFLRLFDLDAVIAETGAVAMVKRTTEDGTPGGIAVLHHEPDAGVRAQNAARRQALADEVMASVPTARLALDNVGRAYDTAFDLVEDGPVLSEEAIAAILAIVERHGITWARSSVHVNTWIGDFNKRTMAERLFKTHFLTALETVKHRVAYAGDSTNDGPMFAAVDVSVGVANIAPFLPRLDEAGMAPAYITAQKGGYGFAVLVDALVAARG